MQKTFPTFGNILFFLLWTYSSHPLMDNFMTSVFNFMSSTVVPAVTEQAGNLVGGATHLAGGAAQVIVSVGQTAIEWSSTSENSIGPAEVYSWEQQRAETSFWWPSSSSVAAVVEKSNTVEKNSAAEEEEEEEKAGTSETPNTSIEWEVVEEDPDVTGPVKHNQFEMVQNDYDWMKNS